MVTNGTIKAAVEVKRLSGDEVSRSYNEALLSLPRALDPGCEGFYVLGPSVALNVPVDRPLLRPLKREIARVAPTLTRGETGGVRLPRSAWVALDWEGGPGRVRCCHNYSEHYFSDMTLQVNGSFLLVDQHLPDHDFVTQESRENFLTELAAACYRRINGGSNHFDWYEEIPLLRCDQEGDQERGIDVLAITKARHVDTAVAEALDYIIEKALAKFDRLERWAQKHVIVLDRVDVMCSPERVTRAFSWYTSAELSNVDLILLIDKDAVSIVWPSS